MARKKSSPIGGQAVLEGVMMRGKKSMATAVRNPDGKIVLETCRLGEKKWWEKIPVLRGFLNFFITMISGSKILMRSAEIYGEQLEEEPASKFEKWLAKTFHVDVMTIASVIGVVLGLALAIGLFVIAPQHLMDFAILRIPGAKEAIPYVVQNLIVGIIRILIFVAYIGFASLMKDIKRVWMYHGAEHKTISCYENDLPLTVENVRTQTTKHDRCGTNFMMIVMIISVLVFTLATSWLGGLKTIYKVLIKLALLPFVAGLSYELLKFMAKFDNWFVRILKAPGLLMQKLTTKEPTDDMIEVAITAFNKVLEMDADESIPTVKFDIKKAYDRCRTEVVSLLSKCEEKETLADWIFTSVVGCTRSELPMLKTITESAYEKAVKIAKEVAKGAPLQYALGDTEFYGYTIKVTTDVLIPRPDTEQVVEKALEFISAESKVLDLCTGSGAIAIAIKKEKDATVTASDISEPALEVAKKNAKENSAEIEFIHSDLFEKIEGVFDLIISNPPYVSKEDMLTLPENVKKEPETALYGGEDGLDFYRRISVDAPSHLTENGVLVLEIGCNQSESICQMLSSWADCETFKDYNGLDRIIVAKKRG